MAQTWDCPVIPRLTKALASVANGAPTPGGGRLVAAGGFRHARGNMRDLWKEIEGQQQANRDKYRFTD
jgi:hypothetical protein